MGILLQAEIIRVAATDRTGSFTVICERIIGNPVRATQLDITSDSLLYLHWRSGSVCCLHFCILTGPERKRERETDSL